MRPDLTPVLSQQLTVGTLYYHWSVTVALTALPDGDLDSTGAGEQCWWR